MSRRAAALFSVISWVLLSSFSATRAWAAATEIPVKGGERILITVPEAVINLQGTAAKSLRIHLADAAGEDYQIFTEGSLISIRPKDGVTKENFGQFQPKKRLIEIQGPSVPLEVHVFEGQVQLTKWGREALVHLQKGRISSKEGSGSLQAHSQTGEILVTDHQGRVDVDAYKSNVVIRNLTGDGDLENFAGETLVDKSKGFLALNQGQGTTKVLGSSGTLQFELTKGVLNVQGFQGRVEGQTQEGPVTVAMALDTDVNLKSQNGRVTVLAPANSGASVNLTTQEGEIVAPNSMKVQRDGSQKTLRTRLKGESQKGSVVVRSQEGTITIR